MTWLCGLAALSFGTGAFATDQAGPPKVSIPEMEQAPALDGVIEKGEWRDAVGNYGFFNQDGARLQHREARFWVGRKGETLYIAIRTETPPGGDILTRVRPDGKRDMSGAFHDDSEVKLIYSTVKKWSKQTSHTDAEAKKQGTTPQ